MSRQKNIPTSSPKHAALDQLFQETSALAHCIGGVAQEIHLQEEATPGRRSIIYELARQGPRTVPQMARWRHKSRQHVQTMVQGLLADGYVKLQENPEHKRSKLVAVTKAGARLAQNMQAREGQLLGLLAPVVSKRDLDHAVQVLKNVREAFENRGWRQVLGVE